MKYKDEYKSSIHSETLFHSFDDIAKLKSILQKKSFIPSYSKESIKIGGEDLPPFFVPMVAFCDFKLSELGFHAKKYGSYGIGMSKEWGVNEGLNPVLYINDKCKVFNVFRKALIDLSKNDISIDNNSTSVQKLMRVYCYIKNYQGPLYRKDKFIENFRFADDKEWRYVPDKETLDLICVEEMVVGVKNAITNPNMVFSEFIREKKLLNQRMTEADHLVFSYEDIKFILVPDLTARDHLILFINDLLEERDAYIPKYKLSNIARKFGCCGILNENNKTQNATKKFRRIREVLISKIVVIEHLDF